MAGPEALPDRRVLVRSWNALSSSWLGPGPTAGPNTLAARVGAVEGDTFAADLVLQVGQQGQGKALLPVRQVVAVLADAFHHGTEDAGSALDTWRPHPFNQGAFSGAGEVLNDIYAGIDVDIAVRNNQAWIYRISYQVTLIGR